MHGNYLSFSFCNAQSVLLPLLQTPTNLNHPQPRTFAPTTQIERLMKAFGYM
jgi:hypothetical protein